MLKMVADESGRGRVYGLDIQKDALENTTSLLDESLNPNEKELVKLFAICHSRMGEVVPKDSSVRPNLDSLSRSVLTNSMKEEFEAVQAFASGLSVESWICCKFQMLNRPLAPYPLARIKTTFKRHLNQEEIRLG
ncbi:hypothetical protein L1049_022843 [Liquidambar formosana]|uniref:Uncharacterized protein n=1 Tax=Liquidambar formosana TaxID=63359 RepID=A0AAP0WQU4_LIQFO